METFENIPAKEGMQMGCHGSLKWLGKVARSRRDRDLKSCQLKLQEGNKQKMVAGRCNKRNDNEENDICLLFP